MNLASKNEIDATPPLFINGRRISGIKDAEQLRQLVSEARKEAVETSVNGSGMMTGEVHSPPH